MSRSLIRKNQLHPDITDLVGEYGSGYFISNQQVVFLTGDQTVSGTKFFADYIELINPNYGIVFNNNSSAYATNVFGNRTGITLTTFQSPTDINIKSDFVGGFVEDVISVRNLDNTGMFGPSINYENISDFNYDSIIIYQTGQGFANVSSKGPYLRLGYHNIISETTGSRLGIGTLFPQEKVHISGGNLKVENSGIFVNGLDLQNSPIINSVPQLVTQTGNFSISGNSNGRMIISNASALITGTIMSGNATGFNASIIQVGTGQIQITGAGAGIKINSYNNQYRTAGQFATISLLHTGNNGYIMYGNTSS